MRMSDKLSELQKSLEIKNAALARATGIDAATVSRYFAGMRLLPVKYIAPLCEGMARLLPDGIPAEALPAELHKWTGDSGIIVPDRLSQAMIAWLMEGMEQEENLRREEKQAKRKQYERKPLTHIENEKSARRRAENQDFAEKLNLLMDISGVSGSQLADALHVDTTLIYKYRAGSRFITRKSESVPIIANTIARYIRSDEQREIILTAAGYRPDEVDIAPEDFGLWIERWLLEKKEADSSPARLFLESVGSFSHFAAGAGVIPLEQIAPLAGDVKQNESFWGIAGMRAAVTRFLYYAAIAEEPLTLYTASTSSIDFLTGDPKWRAVWASLMVHCLLKGHTIKIFHYMADRTVTEIMDALRAFVPLYMAGNLEPYTFTKPQNLTMRYTMFLIEGRAVVNATFGEGLDDAAEYVYSTEPKRLAAQKKNFEVLLASSSSLMDIYRGEKDMDAYITRLGRFWVRPMGASMMLPTLSFGTMPQELLIKMLERGGVAGNARDKILDANSSAALWLRRHFTAYRLDEIIIGGAETRFADIPSHLLSDPIEYTQEEYDEHREYIRQLESEYPHYRLHELADGPFSNIKVFHKNSEVIVEKIGSPAAVFAIENEPMCRGFASFLAQLIAEDD